MILNACSCECVSMVFMDASREEFIYIYSASTETQDKASLEYHHKRKYHESFSDLDS